MVATAAEQPCRRLTSACHHHAAPADLTLLGTTTASRCKAGSPAPAAHMLLHAAGPRLASPKNLASGGNDPNSPYAAALANPPHVAKNIAPPLTAARSTAPTITPMATMDENSNTLNSLPPAAPVALKSALAPLPPGPPSAAAVLEARRAKIRSELQAKRELRRQAVAAQNAAAAMRRRGALAAQANQRSQLRAVQDSLAQSSREDAKHVAQQRRAQADLSRTNNETFRAHEIEAAREHQDKQREVQGASIAAQVRAPCLCVFPPPLRSPPHTPRSARSASPPSRPSRRTARRSRRPGGSRQRSGSATWWRPKTTAPSWKRSARRR